MKHITLVFAFLAIATYSFAQATFTVNSTADNSDLNPNGVCDDGSGACTLRAAIEEANALPGSDTIEFISPGPGPHTIQPAFALPTLTDPVVIDGTTDPDFAGTPIIELDGSNAGSNTHGLNITADSCTVKGLVINRFSLNGVVISGFGARGAPFKAIS